MLVGMQGPTRPSVYDTRPAMNAKPLPAWAATRVGGFSSSSMGGSGECKVLEVGLWARVQ